MEESGVEVREAEAVKIGFNELGGSVPRTFPGWSDFFRGRRVTRARLF